MADGPAALALRRLLHPAYRYLETEVHPLRYLFLELTRRCNLRCRHCGSDCDRDPRPGELGTAEWLAFFDHLAARFDRRRLALVLTGGEPLCHPDCWALFEALRAHGLAFGLVTNGWALTAANVARLRACGVASVTVSLDGLAPAHDWLRGRAGAFDRAVTGVARLAAAGLPFFDVVTCVHPGNLAELPAVRALLQRLGVRAWRLFPIFPRGRAATDAALRLEAADYQRLLRFIAAERRALRGTDFTVSLSCEGYLPPARDASVRDEPYFCRAGISIGGVLCDGTIAACPNIGAGLAQGNLRRDDFATVWEQRFAAYRDRRWMRRGECVSCGEWGRCRGNSLHLWDEARGAPAVCTLRAAGGG
ncbi:MAG TPA: radical SAM protein [Polyangia bacterium]|jgi:radical SAM protein with 4Fe4S-binding SPASM domain